MEWSRSHDHEKKVTHEPRRNWPMSTLWRTCSGNKRWGLLGPCDDLKSHCTRPERPHGMSVFLSAWCFGRFLMFPNSWDDDPIWLIFFQGVGWNHLLVMAVILMQLWYVMVFCQTIITILSADTETTIGLLCRTACCRKTLWWDVGGPRGPSMSQRLRLLGSSQRMS